MNDQPAGSGLPESLDEQAVHRAAVALRSIGHPNSFAGAYDFWDDRYAWRRLFSEVLGTFFLVLVAVGAGMVNARFGGQAVPYGARVVAPGLMVMAVILFMGAVSGAHLNPAVSIAFAVRGDFPWKRVPPYVAAHRGRHAGFPPAARSPGRAEPRLRSFPHPAAVPPGLQPVNATL